MRGALPTELRCRLWLTIFSSCSYFDKGDGCGRAGGGRGRPFLPVTEGAMETIRVDDVVLVFFFSIGSGGVAALQRFCLSLIYHLQIVLTKI